jgi:transposase-like protein
VVAIADVRSADVTPDAGGHKQEAQTRRGLRDMFMVSTATFSMRLNSCNRQFRFQASIGSRSRKRK